MRLVFFSFNRLAPINLNASAPGDFQLLVSWNRSAVLFPPYELNDSPNGTYVDTWAITQVTSFYHAPSIFELVPKEKVLHIQPLEAPCDHFNVNGQSK